MTAPPGAFRPWLRLQRPLPRPRHYCRRSVLDCSVFAVPATVGPGVSAGLVCHLVALHLGRRFRGCFGRHCARHVKRQRKRHNLRWMFHLASFRSGLHHASGKASVS